MKKILLCYLILFFITNLNALTLRDSIEKVIRSNPEVLAEYKNQDAFSKYVDEEKVDYLPTLNLETYYESSHTYNEPDNAPQNDAKKDGWNAQLKLEQLLYDGGLTSSEVSEYRYIRDGNKYRSNLAIENIVLSTTNSYLDMVQYKELLKLSKKMIELQEKNLETAKSQEVISGEVLETYQVKAKLHFTTEQYIEQKDLNFQAKFDFKRFAGIKVSEEICRPQINENLLPLTLEETVEIAVLRNDAILEQIENIKIQREKLVQADTNFLPKITFQLQGQWDDDLELVENGRQDIYRARINMNWNLYKGGKDKIASQREKLFLQEAKKILDSITDEIVAEVTKSYTSYYNTKKRVEALKLYTNDNLNILDVYIKEFDSGTRTFVDILNAESEVYTSKTTLIEREFDLYKKYYNLILNLSLLSDSILSSENIACHKTEDEDLFRIKKEKNEDSELEELFDDNNEKTPLNDEESKNEFIEAPEKLTNVVKDEINNNEELVLDSYIQNLLDAPSKYFTINVATKNGIAEAKELLSKYDLTEEGYAFRFGDNLSNSKVLYGRFATLKEAKIALMNLDNALIKRYNPYIDNIIKHQKLYNKYN